jgi:Flp pilus assembly protein TadB
MRNLVIMLMAVLLYSCSTSKKAATTESSAVVATTDTTKVVTDHASKVVTTTDTTKTVSSVDASTTIEFVEAGGTVSIDTAGNMVIGGVHKIAGNYAGKVQQAAGVSEQTQTTIDSEQRANGVAENTQQQNREQQVVTPAKKWYEKTLIYVGILAIAIVTFILIRWMRRNKYKL